MAPRVWILGIVLATGAVLALSPSASAAVALELDGPHTATVPYMGTKQIPFTLTASASDLMVCPTGGIITVTFELTNRDRDRGFDGALTQGSVFIQVPAGVYDGTHLNWQAQVENTLSVSINAAADPEDPTHTYVIEATWHGDAVMCIMNPLHSRASEARLAVEVTVDFQSPAGSPDALSMTPLALLGLAGAGLARRRQA
jgi:MYXO-CTERM domain-containing protein